MLVTLKTEDLADLKFDHDSTLVLDVMRPSSADKRPHATLESDTIRSRESHLVILGYTINCLKDQPRFLHHHPRALEDRVGVISGVNSHDAIAQPTLLTVQEDLWGNWVGKGTIRISRVS